MSTVAQPMVTAEEIAQELGVAANTVLSWRNAGCPGVPMGGRQVYFNLEKVREWLARNPARGPGKSPVLVNGQNAAELMAAVRIRKETALADRHEYNLQLLRGQVIPLEEVVESRLRRIAVCRANLLAMPGKLAGRLVGRSEKEIYSELETAVRDLLAEFSLPGPEESRQSTKLAPKNMVVDSTKSTGEASVA